MNIFGNIVEIAIWLMIVPVVLIILLAIVVAIIKVVKIYKKKPSNQLDLEQQLKFYEAYGSKDNIVSVGIELSRVTVEVKNLELVNLNNLKELGASGVLVTGNIIKASFKERSQNVYNLLK